MHLDHDHGRPGCASSPARQRRYGAAVTGDPEEGEGPGSGPPGTREAGVAPPFTAPAWIDTDPDELVPPGVVGDPDTGGDLNGEDLIASCVELAMKNLQHRRVRVEPGQEEVPVYCFGSGNSTLYALEDGGDRLMMGRGVGEDGEGCIYCLVGAGSLALLAMLETGELSPAEAFDDAGELTLCSVYQDGQVDNVVMVQHYRVIQDVPVEYRPGQPFLQFTDE